MPHTDPEERKKYMAEYHRKNPDKRRRTAYHRGRRDTMKAFIDEQKDKPCMDCGVKYPPPVMDFHHRDPAEKEFGIRKGVCGLMSRERVEKEIAKCDLLCANCHRMRHMDEEES